MGCIRERCHGVSAVAGLPQKMEAERIPGRTKSCTKSTEERESDGLVCGHSFYFLTRCQILQGVERHQCLTSVKTIFIFARVLEMESMSRRSILPFEAGQRGLSFFP